VFVVIGFPTDLQLGVDLGELRAQFTHVLLIVEDGEPEGLLSTGVLIGDRS